MTALAAALVLLAAVPAPPAWQTLAPGATRATLKTEQGQAIELLRFDLDRFRAAVVVGKGQPPETHTAEELRRGRGAVAAVNGGFFDGRVVPLGLRIAGGEQRFPLRPNADWGVLVLAGRHARIVHTHDYAPPSPQDPIDGAIQVGPRLLVGGVPTKLRPQLARRTGVALDQQGRALTLVVVPERIDANDLAARLAAAGFTDALLLDGGPSTQASVELGSAHLEIAGGYPVPDLLVVFARAPHAR